MREAFGQLFKTNIQKPVVHIGIRKIKNLVLLLFATGFFCFLIFGGRFLDEISLLDSGSLKQIRDIEIDKSNFFRYLCLPHLCLLLICGVLWWNHWGKMVTYTLLGLMAGSLGMCLAVSLVRYRLKGIVLWILLYFPHMFFYFLALICGIALCYNVERGHREKLNFLLQNITWLLGALFSWLLGLYCECYIGSSLLQTYLQFF